MQDLWVFGYGSLMWRPGFDFVERRDARLYGYHREFCVFSHVHRGTPEKPGLVFGLDRGGACRGAAFRVAGEKAAEVYAYLQEREQVTSVYLDVMRPVRLLETGEKVTALCFIVDRAHLQYAGKLSFDDQVRLIAEGKGQSGANPDYLFGTLTHLREIGIKDARLEALWHAVLQRLS
ncbi:ChaC family protein [Tepidicaulis marinus]|jgi:cation transport protein ChaC|uniref:glutathione-specific gamma-glutamylcyclotransferase n=1 Tax=Tepidicaulis marinus TaxID=1333998 RepID=A0A081B8S0_9HYPH|nr:gamma-glutamylcyclotransferase [Tepidicaulis marinus]GAK44438.1 ChaC family protein [Tepidicaulis marinus]